MNPIAENMSRALASALVGAVVAGGAFLLTAASKVTRPEMIEHVDRQVKPVEDRLQSIEDLQRELLVQATTNETKLDLLLQSNAD